MRRTEQCRQQGLAELSQDDEGQDIDSDSDEDQDDETRPRAPRHSRSDGVPSPKTLAFYTGTWKDALIEGKHRFRLYTLLYNAFPLKENGDLKEATRILAAVIAEFKANRRVFDPGQLIFLMGLFFLLMLTAQD